MSDSTTSQKDLSGLWTSTYYFPSNNHTGEDPSSYQVMAEQTGNQLILQSLPNSQNDTRDTGNIGPYILIKLLVDGIYAAGSWTENTDPNGEFGGMIYSGVVQLIQSEDGNTFTGEWVGTGRNISEKRPEVFHGRWQLQRGRSSV